MSRYAAFGLLLAFGIVTFCAADTPAATPAPTAHSNSTATPAPTTNSTTPAPTTNSTTPAPTTNSTTPAPTTNSTTPAPTTNSTTPAPTTNSTTPAPTTNSTTPAPTTNSTTPAPITNSTTAAPATNSTTAAPPVTTTPTPTIPEPPTGKYVIKDHNETCLLANFGLRIGVRQGQKYEEVNIIPSNTNSSGLCGANSSALVLAYEQLTIVFTFTSDSKKFSLHALNVTGTDGFFEENNNLTLWEASVGSSYMCNKEQSYNITDALSIYTFELRVQPFGVQKNDFSTAEDCQADEDNENYLVPIIVGVSLCVLILIVLVAYFIGRKRNRASGYESF